jgi:Domain of unknown function (DUF4331)
VSDHLSSPRALTDPGSDICDLYAFPSPQQPANLVLVMTVYPRATAATRFSDDVVCRFRLRSAATDTNRGRLTIAGTAEEIVFDCTFSEPSAAPDGTPTQRVTCETQTHHKVSAEFGDRTGGRGDGLAVFAGLVSDPFFFHIESIMETYQTGRLALDSRGANTMEGANVLGLVVEVESARWLPDSPLLAIVGETLAAGKRPVRLERVGRPEIKNIGMQWPGNDPVNRTIDVRDLYNQEDAFDVRPDYLGAYRSRLGANLAFFDGLDGKVDWPPNPDGTHPLVDLLLEDFLVVDVTKPFADDSWFEIERAMLDRRSHQTCGGRTLNDAFLDTYYTTFINAGNGPRISDGVREATVPASREFPYLAPANPPVPLLTESQPTGTPA